MSRPLLFLAASGLAREAAEAARAAGARVRGFLDDNPALIGTSCVGAPVLGSIDDVQGYGECALVLGVGAGAGRRSLTQRLARLGIDAAAYGRVVHPSVQPPASATVGRGSILLQGVSLTAEVMVGEHVVLMPGVVATHDCVLEDFATLAAGVLLGGRVRVGEAAYLGMGARVHPDRAIGAAAVLGMGAVVLQDVPAGQIWAGVPARQLPGSGVPTLRPADLSVEAS